MMPAQPVANLITDLPDPLGAERFDDLLVRPGVRVERIVSTGQASPPGFWYDQAWTEWVLLLAGSARLRLESADQAHLLRPGDHLLIPPHARHRVDWTSPDEPTVWLAIHLGEPQG